MIALSSSHHTSLKQNNVWQSIRPSLNHNFLTSFLAVTSGMGIKDNAARVELIKREKAAVEAVVAQYGKV